MKALTDREARRQSLLDTPSVTRPQELRTAPPTSEVRLDLSARLKDWREVLEGSSAEARQMLRLLVVDRLTMTPTSKGYEFGGRGTVRPVFEGLIRNRGRVIHAENAFAAAPVVAEPMATAGGVAMYFKCRPHRDSGLDVLSGSTTRSAATEGFVPIRVERERAAMCLTRSRAIRLATIDMGIRADWRSRRLRRMPESRWGRTA